MSNSNSISSDILVVGSGFAGSITALCLHQQGYKVCVIEKDRHPRFAIGESSTPVADMILRDLSDQYDLPWLSHFSRYGSWQQHYPKITCGPKRGFSYFKHAAGQPFETDAIHTNELMVAASVNKELSDTNWLRSDFDGFLVEKLTEYEIAYLDQTSITSVEKNKRWQMKAQRLDESIAIDAGFLIDATGSSGFLEKFLGIDICPDNFSTNTKALFSHFVDVPHWSTHLREAGFQSRDHPYNPDYSALHHVWDNGWMWMLRFDDDRTSAGFLINQKKNKFQNSKTPLRAWEEIINKFPSLRQLFDKAKLASEPGRVIQTGRLQRRLKKVVGPGWAALPHTAGFIDPLHSTGIAHTLCGVEKIVKILSGLSKNEREVNQNLKRYEASVFRELEVIDLLVAGCYDSLFNFELFRSYVMLYFIASINYEQRRLAGQTPFHFLSAGNRDIADIINRSLKELTLIINKGAGENSVNEFRESVRERIKPYNIAGLLDPGAKNMYRHTAVNIDRTYRQDSN